MTQHVTPNGIAPVAVAIVLSLSIMNTATAANVAPPRVGGWLHTVGKCTNFHNAPTWASDCRHLDGGTWQGANTHPSCIDMAHPRPWSSEALIEPLVSARESGKPTRFTGWMAPGETTSCTGAWSGGMRFTLGVESSNLGMVEVGDSSDTNYMARRWREVSCPDGYRNDAGTCTLPPGELNVHKNNDECPAAPNGSNPVHSSTGKKLQRETDYQGLGPFPLEFKRFYSSGHRSDVDGTHIRPNQLGRNWRHSYSREILLVEGSGGRWVTVVRPNGNEYFFRQNAQGQWIGDPDIPETLGAVEGADGSIDGWRYRNREDETEEYDASGRLVRITNREGFEQHLTYGLMPAEGGDGLPVTLDRVTGPLAGQSLDFKYGDDGNLVQMTAQPSGAVYRFHYDHGLLTRVSYPDDNDHPADPQSHADNPARRYHYDESGHVTSNTPSGALTGIVDESGTRYASWWYSGDRVVRSQLAPDDLENVNRVDFQYHTDGSSTITDALGTSRVYRFRVQHGVARIASITGGKCQTCGSDVQSVTYDANGYRHRVTDFNGNTTHYTHDSRGRETQRIEAYGTPSARTVRTQWHPELRVPVQIDTFAGEGTAGVHLQQTLQQYSGGRLTTRTEMDPGTGSTRTWNYSYNGAGLLAAVDGPRTDVADITTFDYDESGNLASVTNALGHVTSISSYNGHGQPLTIVDPNGVATSLTYDARQRLTSRTIAGETTVFAYTPTGELASMTLPDGSRVTYSHDAAGRLVRVSDGAGNRIEYTLDAMGNRIAEETHDPDGDLVLVQTRIFDELNRLSMHIGSSGAETSATSYEYDGAGRVTRIMAPLGRTTDQIRDALNRMSRVVDPEEGVTEMTHDARDRLTSVRDPRGIVTHYAYDGLDNLVEQVSPDSGPTSYTHDAAGNLRTSTDARDVTTRYQYDGLNRVTEVTRGNQTLRYVYDTGTHGMGRLAGISDEQQSIAWNYDPQGRVVAKEQVVDDLSFTVLYGYADGRRTSLQTPSGQRIAYTYANGRPVAIHLNGNTTILEHAHYQPFGPLTGWVWGNGTTSTRSYDLDGRTTRIDSAGARVYAYDDASRINGIVDLQDLSRSQSHDYDRLDRLIESSGSGILQQWTYDANGNRLTEAGTAVSNFVVDSGSNRLLEATGAVSRSYAYDATGNILSDGTRTFRYDDAGRLESVTRGDAVADYLHNALGQRTRKLVTFGNTQPGDGNSDGRPGGGNGGGKGNGKGSDHPGKGKGKGKGLTGVHPGQGRAKGLEKAKGKGQGLEKARERLQEDVAADRREGRVDTGSHEASSGSDPGLLSETRYFVHDEAGRLLGEYNGDGTLIQETIWLEDTPVATLRPDGNGSVDVFHVHADHLNTPRRLTRPSDNTIVWRWDSDPFGTTLAQEDPDGDGRSVEYNLRFPGQYYDAESGLHYNYFRDYEPHTGRYIQSDPLGVRGGINVYSYAFNNPFWYIDPYGLAPSWVSPAAAVIGATGGALVGIGIISGNVFVGGAGIAFAAAAGGLQIWDVSTTPSEAMKKFRESNEVREIEENLRGLQGLLDEHNGQAGPRCK